MNKYFILFWFVWLDKLVRVSVKFELYFIKKKLSFHFKLLKVKYFTPSYIILTKWAHPSIPL